MVTNASVEDINAAILCLRAAEANKHFTETDTTGSNRNETQNQTQTSRHRVWTINMDNHHLSWVHHHNQNIQNSWESLWYHLNCSDSLCITEKCFSFVLTFLWSENLTHTDTQRFHCSSCRAFSLIHISLFINTAKWSWFSLSFQLFNLSRALELMLIKQKRQTYCQDSVEANEGRWVCVHSNTGSYVVFWSFWHKNAT